VVGAAVQWTVQVATAPADPPAPADAERALSEALVAATHTLEELDVAGGARPGPPGQVRLPQAYGPRRQHALDRALLPHQACAAALPEGGSALPSLEMERRRTALTPSLGLASGVAVAACAAPP